MKTIYITFLLLPLFVKSQSVRHSVFLAPNTSFYKSSNIEAYPIKWINPIRYYFDFGGSVGYKLEYYLPKTLSFGTSFEYLLTRAELYTPCYCAHTMDRTVSIRNQISAHSIDVPVFFKLKTNKKENHFSYFQGGIGLSWLFNAHRKVEIETNFLGGPKDYIREHISDRSFSLQNNNSNGLGTFFQIGIGQGFQIKELNFFTELFYRQDMNQWIYKTIPSTPYDIIREYPIKRQSITLKLGLFLNQNKK